MAALTLSSISVYKVDRGIDRNWVRAADTNFFYKHILARGARLGLAPVSLITHALDIIIGLGAGAATVATLGIEPHTARFASRQLFTSNNIISDPYKNLLRTINPTAKIERFRKPGFLAPLVKRPLKAWANDFRRSDHLLVRHVAARLTYALTGLAMVITRVVDVIFGLIAAALSFLTLGLFKPVNSMAFCGLQATGIVHDLFFCVIRTINPWSQVRF